MQHDTPQVQSHALAGCQRPWPSERSDLNRFLVPAIDELTYNRGVGIHVSSIQPKPDPTLRVREQEDIESRQDDNRRGNSGRSSIAQMVRTDNGGRNEGMSG